MKYLIFGSTKERGIAKFEELIGALKFKEVKRLHKSMSCAFAELCDGSTYEVISASDSARGYKADKAYVDREFCHEIIMDVIACCLVTSTLPEESRVQFFE